MSHKPQLIFLHNGLESAATWNWQMEKFMREGFSCYAWNRPGYGGEPEDPLYLGDLVEDGAKFLHERITETGVERAVLVGHCIGAAIAIAWANAHPERVAALVLEAGGYYSNDFSTERIDYLPTDFRLLPDPERAHLVEMHGEAQAARIWFHFRQETSSYVMNPEWDIRPKLRTLPHPKLVIQGDRDYYFSKDHAATAVHDVAGVELHTISKGRHDIHGEHPELFHAMVMDFLRRVFHQIA